MVTTVMNEHPRKIHIQFPINIKSLISPNLHPPHPLRADFRVLDRRVELVAPRAAVAVTVAVVVAQQVVAPRLLAPADFERLVYRGEELFFLVWN